MDLSVVIPIYNEEESVKFLYEAVTKALLELNRPYEILLVDDRSKDNTYRNALSLAQADPRLKIVKLKRNYGQTTALHAGFQNVKGKVIVTMDGDLQNDPDDIPALLNKYGTDLNYVKHGHSILQSITSAGEIIESNEAVIKVMDIDKKLNRAKLRVELKEELYNSKSNKIFFLYDDCYFNLVKEVSVPEKLQ